MSIENIKAEPRAERNGLRAILAERERELLELKGPCRAPRCRLHFAHYGPCHVEAS